jgi:hypothetical protein
MVLFDNGGARAGAFQEQLPMEQRYSRIVEYAIDAENLEVEELWTYGGPGDDQFFSAFLGDADWLPETSNLLITDGARILVPEGGPAGADEAEEAEEAEEADEAEEPIEIIDLLQNSIFWGRVLEVTHTQPAEIVFEVQVKQEEGPGVLVYRAERLPSLYP